jgi:hypothetical protein
MATFILTCFVVFILAFIAKLIYDVQQTKKSVKIQQNEITADEVDAFQKLAGIKPTNPNDELREILVKNNLNTEKITEELKKEFENSEFPAPDQSIPMITAKLTTIELGSKEETDPLGSVPMSRVSKEAKQKMAEIAKQDISDQLEKNAEKFANLIKNQPSEYDQRLGIELVKPKTKKRNPKQDIKGIVDETTPFKKTRKKATKKKKENE